MGRSLFLKGPPFFNRMTPGADESILSIDFKLPQCIRIPTVVPSVSKLLIPLCPLDTFLDGF